MQNVYDRLDSLIQGPGGETIYYSDELMASREPSEISIILMSGSSV